MHGLEKSVREPENTTLKAPASKNLCNVRVYKQSKRFVMKFVCDEMLKRLGRWLRAAGYDTVIKEDGADDRQLLNLALRENRLLITRDAKLIEFRDAPGTVVLLRANNLEDCIRELTQRLKIDWFYRPFSRCMICNNPITVAPAQKWNELPNSVRSHIRHLYYCPHCDQLFWEGGHVQRMQRKLALWQTFAG
jgi:uncharacterized protein with PIN domain